MIALTLAFVLSLAAADGRDNVNVAISLESGAGRPVAAIVTVANASRAPVCLMRNYSANPRLVASRGGRKLAQQNSFEGRPIPGCATLEPGQAVYVRYELQALYPGIDLSRATLCYRLWTHGAGPESKTVCKVAK